MKKNYISPELKTVMFSESVCASDTSGITNGVDMTQETLRQQNISNTESSPLESFSIVF